MSRIDRLTNEQWDLVSKERERWRAVGLCTDPADRDTAERVVRGFYNRMGAGEPAIYWADSPASACLMAPLIAAASGLRSQLSGELSDQISDQLAGQLQGQLSGQLSCQLSGELYDQLFGQLSDQLFGQLSDQLWDQLSCQLSDQPWGQLWAQLRGQLVGQLSGQFSGQFSGELSGELSDQLSDQLWEQFSGQLRGQLWAQLRGQLVGQLSGQLVEHARPVLGAWMCGSEWSYWIGHYVTVRDVVGVQYGKEQSELLDEWSALAHSCGWWFPFEDFAILCERPDRLSFNERAQLHSADGPAIRYRDGYSVYAWHGQRVPADWIEDPTSITPEVVFRWENLDQRQAAADILGWDRLLDAVDARMVDRNPDPEIGVLYECDLPDAPGSKVLRVRCGTGRAFGIPVPDHITTASEAQEWMWGRHDYAPEVRT